MNLLKTNFIIIDISEHFSSELLTFRYFSGDLTLVEILFNKSKKRMVKLSLSTCRIFFQKISPLPLSTG